MFEHIKTRTAARVFFVLAILLLLLLACVRFYVIPTYQKDTGITWGQFGADVTLGLFSAAFEATIITALLLFLVPRKDTENGGNSGVAEIWGHRLNESLRKIVGDPKGNYWFRGRSGRWFRFYVLPRLAQQGSAGTSTTVKVHLLDPGDTDACSRYVEYRNQLKRPTNDEPWSLSRIQMELVATIVSCYAWAASSTTKIEVFLSPTFSLFRLDMSGSAAILTREDPHMPALHIPAGSYLYDSFRYDFMLSEAQARKLGPAKTRPIEETTENSIRELLAELKINHALTSENLTSIVAKVKSPKDPYG